jgi:hypothetical protein
MIQYIYIKWNFEIYTSNILIHYLFSIQISAGEVVALSILKNAGLCTSKNTGNLIYRTIYRKFRLNFQSV